MASYGTKFRFRWQAANGADYEIDVKEKDYTGDIYDRPMGSAPLLKRESNGHIYGTSLTVYAECKVDGEFSSLYTSDPTMYLVELYQGTTLMWTGYVTPELYSEPDIAPPYDVTIVATDGLGELKRSEWGPTSTFQTLYGHLTYLLNFTGLLLSIDMVSSMHTSTTTWRTLFTHCSVDFADREGDTCYDVLEELLSSLNMRITQQAGRWLLLRETDATTSTASGPPRLVCYSLTRGSEIYDHVLVSIGSLGQNYKFWPVGQLSSEITPGCRAVTVKAPNYFKESALTNSDITKDTGWTKVSQVSFQSLGGDFDHAFYLLNGFSSYDKDYKDDTLDSYSRGIISQQIQLNTMTRAMRLTLDLGSDESMYSEGLRVRVKVTYKGITTGSTYYLQQYTNDGNTKTIWRNYNSSVYAYVDGANSRQTTEFIIPAIPEPSYLTIQIEGSVQRASGTTQSQYSTRVFGAYLTYASELVGQQLRVVLGNNARDEMSEVETVLSTWDSARTNDDDAKRFCNGLVLYNTSTPVYDWQSDKLGAQDYLGFIAMDLALAGALPRLVKTGKVFIGTGFARVPLLMRSASIDYLVDTFTYDLLESEFDFSMTSLPATTLTVSSEERSSIPTTAGSGSYSSSGSSGSSSGGGGGTGTVTSVGLTVPTGLKVSGSPITSSGVLAVTLQDGYTIPTTDSQIGWDKAATAAHSHSNKTVLDGITAAKVEQWDAASGDALEKYSVPRLQIVKGTSGGTQFRTLHIIHPCIGKTGYEVVLMVYSSRNAGKHKTSQQLTKRRPKKGWCEARGTGATPYTVSTGSIDLLTALPQFILQNYVRRKGYTMEQKKSWTIAYWRGLQRTSGTTVDRTSDGFDGARDVSNVGHTVHTKRFGIAIRWTNPDFAPSSSKTLTNNTMIDSAGNSRYFYSAVAPLDCYINIFDLGVGGTGSTDTADICFGLAGK